MRLHLCVLSAAACAVLLAPGVGQAQPPDLLTHYNVVPRGSVLRQSGGFAGQSVRYRLWGDYDFAQEWSGGTTTEPYQRTARFVDAKISAPLGPMLPAFLDVGDLLNLEGLRGELLPLGAPFDVYKFSGIIHDGIPASPLESSKIDLYAALAGPWMYVYGETTPPVGSADMFEYELKMLARRGHWADWNEDGVVDAADYTVLRDRSHLAAATDGGWADEYDVWRTQFGETAPSDAEMESMFALAASAAHATAIPEPATLVLIAIGATAGLVATRRRA